MTGIAYAPLSISSIDSTMASGSLRAEGLLNTGLWGSPKRRGKVCQHNLTATETADKCKQYKTETGSPWIARRRQLQSDLQAPDYTQVSAIWQEPRKVQTSR